MFGVINGLGALQYEQLKKSSSLSSTAKIVRRQAPLRTLRQILYQFSRYFVVALGSQTHKLFPHSLPLTILYDYTIQIVSRISVHQILVDPK